MCVVFICYNIKPLGWLRRSLLKSEKDVIFILCLSACGEGHRGNRFFPEGQPPCKSAILQKWNFQVYFFPNSFFFLPWVIYKCFLAVPLLSPLYPGRFIYLLFYFWIPYVCSFCSYLKFSWQRQPLYGKFVGFMVVVIISLFPNFWDLWLSGPSLCYASVLAVSLSFLCLTFIPPKQLLQNVSSPPIVVLQCWCMRSLW